MQQDLEEYKKYVREKIDGLTPLFAKAAIGDFSETVKIPEGNDEFVELYTGVQIMLEVINEKISDLNRINEELSEKQIKTEQEKLIDEAVLENIGEGLLVTDTKGVVTVLNRAGEKLLGITSEDIVGKNLTTAIKMEDEKGNIVIDSNRPLTQAITTGKAISGNYFYLHRDGSKFLAEIIVTPMILNGNIFGTIEMIHDITAEKEIEHMKDELISLSSHELRTPMTAIKGYLSMIENGDFGQISQELNKPLKIIATSTDRLITLVNNMLEVSRIDAKKVNFNITDFEVGPIVREVIESLYPIAKDKGIEIRSEGNKIFAQADVDKVREILNNIIGNAIKFTEHGEVVIKVFENKESVDIEIRDTGIGITSQEKVKLFKKFQQVSTTERGKPQGTGLGLYISREIAKSMGGTLNLASSEPGKGSIFVLSLPRARAFPLDNGRVIG